jgi:hypothetical protein
LVYFIVIWDIFPVLVCCTKKNLATLFESVAFIYPDSQEYFQKSFQGRREQGDKNGRFFARWVMFTLGIFLFTYGKKHRFFTTFSRCKS